MEASRADLPDPQRAVVYTPKAGDVVVLEVPDDRAFSREDADRLKAQAEEAFGHDVKVVVVAGAHFAGVVRDE